MKGFINKTAAVITFMLFPTLVFASGPGELVGSWDLDGGTDGFDIRIQPDGYGGYEVIHNEGADDEFSQWLDEDGVATYYEYGVYYKERYKEKNGKLYHATGSDSNADNKVSGNEMHISGIYSPE